MAQNDEHTLIEGKLDGASFLDTLLRTFVLSEALGLTTIGEIKADVLHPLYGPVVITVARPE